jgi:hypothetical protein
LSGILETREHVSETGSVSALRGGREDTYSVGSLKKELTSITDPFSETLCSLVSRIADDGKSPKTQ